MKCVLGDRELGEDPWFHGSNEIWYKMRLRRQSCIMKVPCMLCHGFSMEERIMEVLYFKEGRFSENQVYILERYF